MAHRSTHRRPWRLSSSRVGCLLLLPAVCSAWQTPGGVRRVQHTSRWRLQQDSLLAGRDRDGVRTSPRFHGCSRVGVLRCSAGLAAVDEPASGSDVSVGKYSKKNAVFESQEMCRDHLHDTGYSGRGTTGLASTSCTHTWRHLVDRQNK